MTGTPRTTSIGMDSRHGMAIHGIGQPAGTAGVEAGQGLSPSQAGYAA